MFYVILQAIIPPFLVWHGYQLRFKTQPFNSVRGGLSTWRTREGEAQWVIGNHAGGIFCIIAGIVLGIMYIAKLIIYGTDTVMAYNYAYAAVAAVGIFGIAPVAHAVINKKLGIKGPKLSEQHVARPAAPKRSTAPKRSAARMSADSRELAKNAANANKHPAGRKKRSGKKKKR